jgi:protein TonB
VTPRYPDEAKSRGIQGKVQFKAIIDQAGKIRNLELVTAPLALYKAARDAVSQWQYRPTTINGEPVEVVTQVDVVYTLAR